jgi:hypothetical protein
MYSGRCGRSGRTSAKAHSEELLVEALRPRPPPEFAQTHVYILALLASTSLDRDDLAGGERHAAEAEGLVSERRLDEQPFVALVHVARGRLLERRAESAGAAASFGRAVELARRRQRQSAAIAVRECLADD